MKTFRIFLSGFGLLLLSLNLSAENLHVFKHENKFGYFDDNLEIRIEPVYDDASDFNDGYAIVKYSYETDKKYRRSVYNIINEKNGVESADSITSHRFYYLGQNFYYCDEPFHQYLFNAKTKARHNVFGSFYGSYDCFDWDYLGNDSHLIDKNGNTIEVPGEWRKIYDQAFGAGYAVTKDFKMKIIDKNGRTILENIYDCAEVFSEGLMAVQTKSRSGYINTKGEFVIDCDFVPFFAEFNPPLLNYPFKEGVAVPQVKRGVYKIIDRNGKEILGETKLVSASFCSDGYILARHASSLKFGYFDKTGKLAVPFVLDNAENFKNGFAIAVLDGKDIVISGAERKYFFTQDLMSGSSPDFKNF